MIASIVFALSCFVCSVEAQPSYYDSGVSACIPGSGHDHYRFCNTSLPIDERVADLIKRIDDEDKPNLLTARGHLGHAGRQALPKIGVPSYYWGTNCIHGAMSANCTTDGRCATSFPSGPNWAASFDRELMRRMAAVAGKEQRAFFNLGNFTDNGNNGMGLDCWGPVLNVNRDPRWGRHGEGGTEDPYLMGELGTAWTKGLQKGEGEDSRFLQVAVTLKHFDANSLEGGAKADKGFDRHTVDVKLTNYLLADYYWPAFRASILKGDAKGVMCSYNSVNGRPTCTDPLMKAARETWNFSGYVTSDSDAVADAYRTHKYVKTAEEASCLAVKDGQCDVDSGNTYYGSLLGGVSKGYCSMEDVDRALFNTFRVRFELGLFDPIEDQPFWKFSQRDIGTVEATALNLQAAQSSLVLLRNPKSILPLKRGQRIAMIGPHANATMDLIQVDTGAVCPDAANEQWNNGRGSDPTAFSCVTGTFSAVKALNDKAGGSTVYAAGCGLSSNISGGLEEALAAAAAADTVILGLGISERRDIAGPFKEAEAHDRDSIDLPAEQKALARAIIALGKPTVIYLLNGGMVAIDEFVGSDVAIIDAFYPGKEGALALAQSIFGESNRWGKMPYTVYKANWVDSNSMLDHDVTHHRTYRYGADAVVPFGTGLSLTKFKLSMMPCAAKGLLRTDETGTKQYQIKITNVGAFAGDEIVMAYFHPKKVNLELHPQKSLFDFQRVSNLQVGAHTVVSFSVNQDSMLLATESGDLVRSPGDYFLTFENGAGEVLEADFTFVGPQVVVEAFPHTVAGTTSFVV